MKHTKKEEKLPGENREKQTKREINIQEMTPLGKHKPGRKYPPWFYFILIGIPIGFFVLLESGLRVFNYGRDFTVFIPLTRESPEVLYLNPEIPFKYFSNIKIAPTIIPDGFDRIKKKGTFRVFVFGESSAAGWPYSPNASFSRYIKRRLSMIYPENKIEVINLGMSAISTFTMRDLLPAVLKQQPDLILFYNGHNEYYGALGAASTESLGRHSGVVSMVVKLQRFRTVQFLKSIIRAVAGIFSSSQSNSAQNSNETLMARMVGDNLVPMNSATYRAGLEQFEDNMRYMLEKIRQADVPVLVGTLISNLSSQPPFVSLTQKGEPSASDVYRQAKQALAAGNTNQARSLFYKAKDLDALRFRAPEDINKIIRKLAGQLEIPLVEVDSEFNKSSPQGITGNNLMVDHLHPNIDGYQLLGKAFFREMKAHSYLPAASPVIMSEQTQDSLMKANFPFTKLDSTVAGIRIKILLRSYPFVPKGAPNYVLDSIKLKDFSDTMAVEIITRNVYWRKAHIEVAKWYFAKKNMAGFTQEMNAVIEERPEYEANYEFTANMLISANFYDLALPYLKRLHLLKQSAFTGKWLGSIYLQKQQYQEAVYYLENSIQFDGADAQVWYNLSGAYYYTSQPEKSFEAIKKCLSIDPAYPQAKYFYSQLAGYLRSR